MSRKRQAMAVARLALCGGLAAGGLWVGCVSETGPADTSETMRFHDWWNFYARGAERIRREDYAGGRADMEVCLGLQRGARYAAPEDKWRERTYGLHILENYFPNRELGVCLYHQGETGRAVQFLEQSLRQQPSGRAMHYLNLARRRALEASAAAAPAIRLDPSARSPWSRARSRAVAGVAQGPGYVKRVSINGQPVFQELARETIRFNETVALREGSNAIVIAAEDLKGHRSQETLLWLADWRPPQIAVVKTARRGAAWDVEAVCRDDQALASVSINGLATFQAPAGPRVAAKPLHLTVAAGGWSVIRAQDCAGNAIEYVLSADDLESAAVADPLANLALNDNAPARLMPLLAQARAEAAPPAGDTLPPRLQLRGVKDVVTVFDDQFYLEGEAKDRGGLASVLVGSGQGGEDWLRAGNRGSERVCFADFVPLAAGTNRITVTARDRAGNQSQESFVVVRRAPEYLDAEFRLRVAAPPAFADPPIPWLRDIRRVDQYLGESLSENPVRFHLIRRDGGQWEQVQRELELSASGLVDPRAAIRLGRIMSAEKLFLCKAFAEGRDGMSVWAEVVDAASGESAFTENIYAESGDDLRERVRGLVFKIKQRFPLVETTVADVQRQRVALAAGDAAGVTRGTSFIVVTKDQSQPLLKAGKVVAFKSVCVKLEVARVEKAQSLAEVVPEEAAGLIKVGDFAYTR